MYERTLITDDYMKLSDIGRILEKHGLYGPGSLSAYQTIGRGGTNKLDKITNPTQRKKIKTLFSEIDRILGKPTTLDAIYKLPKYGSLGTTKGKCQMENGG